MRWHARRLGRTPQAVAQVMLRERKIRLDFPRAPIENPMHVRLRPHRTRH
jgi:hypothetical protein